MPNKRAIRAPPLRHVGPERAKVAMRIYRGAENGRMPFTYAQLSPGGKEGSERGRKDDGKPRTRIRFGDGKREGGREGGSEGAPCGKCASERAEEREREDDDKRVIWSGKGFRHFLTVRRRCRVRTIYLRGVIFLPFHRPCCFQLIVRSSARTDRRRGGHNGLHTLSHRDDTHRAPARAYLDL